MKLKINSHRNYLGTNNECRPTTLSLIPNLKDLATLASLMKEMFNVSGASLLGAAFGLN